MRTIRVDRSLLRSLLVLASVLEVNDPYSGGHVWRTSRYARALAGAAGCSEGDVFLAQIGGLVHDVGKVGIPDSILLKEGQVSEEERRVIQLHPEIGASIIANHPLAPLVERPISEHHLRADGDGYPSRLKGSGPGLISRIVSIADAFDAMTSFHPSRRDDAVDHALRVLHQERGRQFDAALADLFLELVRGGALNHVLDHAADGSLQSSCPECGPIVSPPAPSIPDEAVSCPSSEGDFALAFAPGTFAMAWADRSPDSR